MAAGLVSSAVAAVASGFERAPPELVAARRATCREGRGLAPDQVRDGHCDHYRPGDDRCGGAGACGCYIGPKSTMLAWDCPLGRWPG